MREVEAKVLAIDVADCVARLQKLGFVKSFDDDITTIYFKTGVVDGKTLRLRTIDNMTYMTVKRTVKGTTTKDAQEFEFVVSDKEVARQALLALGFVEGKTQTKHRVSFALGEVHCEFDTMPGIPTFLEIEAHDPATIETVAKQLGISFERLLNWTGGDVLKHYQR